MLSLNFSQESEGYWQNVWKILIYDDFGRDILSPLYTVDSLHKAGVTLHMMLNYPRQEVPDVPAIYFVMPTIENINRICEDCSNRLYENCYINFISSVPTEVLEEMARKAFLSNCTKQIMKVHDQYIDFIAMEDQLFTLNQPNSYFNFNNPQINDKEAMHNVDMVVNSLFSVLVTLGKIPIIQCLKGSTSVMIAEQLNKKIADHLKTSPNLFTDSNTVGGSYQRPVLLLLDRNLDLKVMLSHSWSYQSLIHDIFDMKLNRIELIAKPKHEKEKPKKEHFDFDETDPFWMAHSGSPFPKVIVSIQQQVEEHKKKEARVKSATTDASVESGDAEEISLQDKISQIPDLNRQKEILQIHTTIAAALVERINARQLDVYFTLEEVIMMNQGSKLQDIISAIENEKGTCEDKLRLFLIYYISNSNKITQSDLALLESKLSEKKCNLQSLRYLQNIKSFTDHWATSTGNAETKKNENWLNMFSSIVSKGVEFLIPVNKDFYVTKVVDSIMEIKDDKYSKDFLYWDPRFPVGTAPKKTTPFKEAIVFMVGGGNYLEYQNIRDYLAKPTQQQNQTSISPSLDKKIIYGSTEILTGSAFLKQLEMLGSK
jgi:hypothetical protein